MVEIKNRFTGSVLGRGATMVDAIHSCSDLSYSDLSGSDLRGSDLSGSNLSYSDLSGSDLRGIKVAFQSHDLIAEILRRAAGNELEKLKIAGVVLLCRDKCWSDFLALNDPLTAWALEELAKWIKPGQEVPEALKGKPCRSTS